MSHNRFSSLLRSRSPASHFHVLVGRIGRISAIEKRSSPGERESGRAASAATGIASSSSARIDLDKSQGQSLVAFLLNYLLGIDPDGSVAAAMGQFPMDGQSDAPSRPKQGEVART